MYAHEKDTHVPAAGRGQQCILPGDPSLPQDRSRRAAQTNLAKVLPRPSLSGWVPGQPADLHHRPPRQPFAWPPGARAHAEPTSGRHCLCPSLGSFPEEWDSWSICISRSKVCQAPLCSANRLRVVDGSWLCLPPHHSQPAPCRAWACRVVSSLQAPLLQSQVGEARLPLISPNLPYTVAPSVIFSTGTPLRTKQ